MTGPGVIQREQLVGQLRDARPWDVLVIGGGATGLGIAVDAAARGYRTALIEARDFSSGTSSRSTKLVHGGVRYLAQGNVKLVREALAERALLLANAPELVHPLEFIVPCYRLFEREFMRIGLGMYDALAGRRGIGATRWLSSAQTRSTCPVCVPPGTPGRSRVLGRAVRRCPPRDRADAHRGRTRRHRAELRARRADRGRRRQRAACRRGRRRVRRAVRAAGKGGVQRRGRLGRCGPSSRGRQRSAAHHGQPRLAHRARPPIHAGRVRLDDPEDARRSRAVRHSVARAAASSAPPTSRSTARRGIRSLPRARSSSSSRRRAGTCRRRLARRRPVRLRRAAAAVLAGRARRHQDDFPRARDRHRARQPADRDRRQVDDVPPDGARRVWRRRRAAGCSTSGRVPPKTSAWRSIRVSKPRIGRRRPRPRAAMRRGCTRTCASPSSGNRRVARRTSSRAGCASDCCRTA